MRSLDPFLMLDFFKVRLPAGFPDHPHRGFETVTYMVEGTFHHEDFKGHKVRTYTEVSKISRDFNIFWIILLFLHFDSF